MSSSNNIKDIKFSNEAFYRFLKNFDPICCRYDISEKDLENTDINELYLYLHKFEQRYYIFDFNSHDYSNILNNLKLIYGNSENLDRFVGVYKAVHEKIIGEYLNIEGLDKLYNQSYFNFEWEMHLSINYNKQESFFYRDHFIHQVRNLFEVHVLLDDLNFMRNCLDVITTGENDIYVSNYINRMADIAIKEMYTSPDKEAYKYKKYINYIKAEHSNVKKDKIIRDLFLKNIIRSSLFITALFHDIGYPVSHIMNGRENIEKFLPNIHYFIDNEGHFGRICAQLANTLLFTLVKKDEIQKKYDKKDHGTISALALLLYYYENGTIYSLTKDKRAAIEIAALAIYDHTIHAKYNTDPNTYRDEKDPYFRLLFYHNPISYLFRFCDDIQEWERVYFNVDDKTHFKICHKCKTPLIRVPINIDKLLKGNNKYIIDEEYVDFLRNRDIKIDTCACTRKEHLIEKLEKTFLYSFGNSKAEKDVQFLEFDDTEFRHRSDIQYRKLHHIKTCHSVDLEPKTGDDKIDEYGNKETNKLLLSINYSPYKLLQMSFIAPSFSKNRSKDLKQIKKYVDYQDGFPRIIIKSDITTNPIILKVNILSDFIKSVAEYDSNKKYIHKLALNDTLIDRFKNINNSLMEVFKNNNKGFIKAELIDVFKLIIYYVYQKHDDIDNSITNNIYKIIAERINEQLEFYIDLLIIKEEYLGEIKNNRNLDLKEKYKKDMDIVKSKFYGKEDIVDCLIDDCFDNFIALIDFETFRDNNDFLPEKYYNIYNIENKLIDAITQFTSEDRYDPFNESKSLDAFIDIYFFKLLSNYIYLEYSSNNSLSLQDV